MIEGVDGMQDVFRERGPLLALWTGLKAGNGSVQTGLLLQLQIPEAISAVAVSCEPDTSIAYLPWAVARRQV